MRWFPGFSATLMLLWLSAAPSVAQESVDLNTVNRIRDEGFHHSQVMDLVLHLTDEIGPRITASPQMRRASDWALSKFDAWGLEDGHREGFEFGRGWSFERTAVHMISPHKVPLIALPKAWTPGTDGPVRGQAMAVQIEDESDFERYRGKLRGKILFLDEAKKFDEPEGEVVRRLSPEQLAELGAHKIPDGKPNHRKEMAVRRWKFRLVFTEFLRQEGVLATVSISSRDAGLVRVMGYTYRVGETPAQPQLVMAAEHYNRIMRYLEDDREVILELDITAQFHDSEEGRAYNTIAEIRGKNRREVVMAGAHLDSWHGGMGGVDNGAGVAIIMEAARILSKLQLKPERTIRFALWSAEEQGLLGSYAYVRRHFASRPEPTDPAERYVPLGAREDMGWPLTLKKDHKNLFAYFNVDNGSGKIRGIYAEENTAAKPIFEAWLRPFSDLDANTGSPRHAVGTDHLSFQYVGLPGFQFIQDRLDYSTRLHHTNIDAFDHVVPEEMKQAAVILASFLYHAAMRPEMLPRKPLPVPPTAAEKEELEKLKAKAKRARERKARREQ